MRQGPARRGCSARRSAAAGPALADRGSNSCRRKRRTRTGSRCGQLPVRADGHRDLPHVAPKLFKRRPPEVPVAVVGAVHLEVRRERERRGQVGIVERVRGLEEAEPRQPAPLRVGQEREPRTEPGAEGALNLRRIHAHHDDPRIGDLELVLELTQPTHVALLLGTPPSSRGEERDRVARSQLPQQARTAGVVRQVEVRECAAGLHVSGALAKFTENARHQITTVVYRSRSSSRERSYCWLPLLPLRAPRSTKSLTSDSSRAGPATRYTRRSGPLSTSKFVSVSTRAPAAVRIAVAVPAAECATGSKLPRRSSMLREPSGVTRSTRSLTSSSRNMERPR